MSTKSWMAALLSVMVMCLAVSCANRKPVPPVRETGRGAAEGITLEEAKLGGREVAGSADKVAEGKWYEKAGRPRILVLFNRRFAGDAELWRTDARFVLDARGGYTRRSTDKDKGEETATGGGQVVSRVQHRTDQSADLLPEAAAARAKSAFLKPLIAAKCTIVDPSVLDRIAQAETSRAEGHEHTRDPMNASTDAYLKAADWLIETVAVPSDRSRTPFFLNAKAVDLKTRSVLAYASTQDMVSLGQLPGTEDSRPKAVPVEDQAEWLVSALISQLD